MKNKILSILVMGFILLTIAQAGYSAVAVTESLQVILTKQSPYPVEPGQVVDIEVSLQNNGYGEAQNIILEINPNNPFTLLPGQEKTKSFSRVAAKDHVTATYRLYVANDAISDNYEIEFNYYQAGSTEVKNTGKVMVQVQGKPKLILEKITTNPVDIEPGDTVTINAVIKNMGTGSASLIEANMMSNTSYIIPVFSGGLYYVGEIKPGQSGEAIFEMSIDNSAEYKTYPGVLVLSYKDESGISQTANFFVGTPVRGKPVIEILSTKIENSDFKVDVENIGTANAKALKIMLVQGGEVKDSAIANELRPSKYKTIRFKGFGYGSALINITYLDENNQFFSEEIPVSITQSSYSQENTDNGLSPIIPILIVVIVLESYYVWRLRKQAKK
jgi:hypothetical protein